MGILEANRGENRGGGCVGRGRHRGEQSTYLDMRRDCSMCDHRYRVSGLPGIPAD